MSRFKQHKPGPDGWSDWDTPVMHGFRMGCCDCGLVHDMQFRVLKVVKHNPDGTFSAIEQEPGRFRVEMRARRNNRSTAQMRRARQEPKA